MEYSKDGNINSNLKNKEDINSKENIKNSLEKINVDIYINVINDIYNSKEYKGLDNEHNNLKDVSENVDQDKSKEVLSFKEKNFLKKINIKEK